MNRIAGIRSRLWRERAVRYQRSLFDRRADTAAAARDADARRLDDALARILRGLDTAIGARRIELAAMWPERRR